MNPSSTPALSGVRVRPATLADAATILELWQSSARWLLSKGIVQWRPEYFNRDSVVEFLTNGSDAYVAEIDGVAVGTYVVTWSDPVIWEELDDGQAGYIHRFAVNREYKGSGIGTYLIRSAEEQIRSKGKKHVRLDCMADNERLNRYYAELGFRFVRRLDMPGGWSANLYEKPERAGPTGDDEKERGL